MKHESEYLLAIDLGNTNLTIGLYENGSLGSHWRLATDHNRMPDEYGMQLMGLLQTAEIDPGCLKGVCLSSVVPPLTGRLLQASDQYLKQEPLLISHELNTGIQVLYEDPFSVGTDRIADAVAVNRLYGGPACIIDFGTATTFNALTSGAEYLGGAITAGLGVSSEALFNRAAKLPRVDLKRPPSVIGRNTTHAMQSGFIFGYASMVEGMVARFRLILGDEMKVIATGGLAEVIAPEAPSIQILAPWLTLDGISILWEMNNH